MFGRKVETIMGHRLPAPRITASGFWFAFKYVLGPFLGGLFLLDLLMWLVFDRYLDSCYAVMCLFE